MVDGFNGKSEDFFVASLLTGIGVASKVRWRVTRRAIGEGRVFVVGFFMVCTARERDRHDAVNKEARGNRFKEVRHNLAVLS